MADEPAEGPAVSDTAGDRKPYRKPEIVTWGTLRDLTQAVGNSGSKDGGHGRNHRTR